MFSVRACVLETVMKAHCGAPKRQKWCQHTAALCPVSAAVKLQSPEPTRKLDFGVSQHFWALNRTIWEMRTESTVLTMVFTGISQHENGVTLMHLYFQTILSVQQWQNFYQETHTSTLLNLQSPATACLCSSPHAPGTHSLQVANCSSRWSQNTERNWWQEKKEPFISTPLCPEQKWEDSGYARVCMQSRVSQLKTGSYIHDYAGLLEGRAISGLTVTQFIGNSQKILTL